MNGHTFASDTRHRIAAMIIIVAFHFAIASLTTAQTYYCLPTCSQTDARFLSLAGSSFKSVSGDQIAITLAAAATTDSITFEIFDGETGGVWDKGTSPLTFMLFADPAGDGSGTQRVGQWSGNSMSDSAWYRVAVAHNANALAESGAYFYTLKIRIAWGDSSDANNIEDDAEDANALTTWSNFKIRSTANITTSQFAFCAPMFSTREANIIYPNYPLLINPTYDGSWSLFAQVPQALDSLELWDGDMDFGSWDGISVDGNDANTNSLPRWAGSSSVSEGVASGSDFIRNQLRAVTGTLATGSPMDDNLSLSYRRSPSVYYDVIEPNGRSFRNSNPSGNLEWERFVIGTASTSTPDASSTYLRRGVYEVRITGMDLHNLNAWRYGAGIVGVSSTGVDAPMPSAGCATTPRSFGRGPGSESSSEVSETGELYTWGDNCTGQLGDGTETDRDEPVKVLKGDYPGATYLGDLCGGVAQAAVSHRSMIAVLNDGNVYAWGNNPSSLLGVNSTTSVITAPKRVIKGAYTGTTYLGDSWTNPIEAVAAGAEHMAAASAAGLVYAWGVNDHGQCGDGTTTDRTAPVLVLKGEYSGTTYLGDNPSNPIVDVVAGAVTTYALAADGTVYSWGRNRNGELGNDSRTSSSIPVRVVKGAYAGTTYLGDASSNPIKSIAAMRAGGMALASDGTVFTWGTNSDGQLGDNTTTERRSPVKVLRGAYAGTTYLGDASSQKIVQITAGDSHSLALTALGQVYAWGGNADGQLGDNSTTDRLTPIRVRKGEYVGTTYIGDGTETITAIGGALRHSLALSGATETTYAWGHGASGRLGEGTLTNYNTPITVAQGARPIANGDNNSNDGVAPIAPPSVDVLSIDNVNVQPDENMIYVTMNAKEEIEADMNLFGANGNAVSLPFANAHMVSGLQRIAISLPVDLPSGLYFVNVNTGSGTVAKQFMLTR